MTPLPDSLREKLEAISGGCGECGEHSATDLWDILCEGAEHPELSYDSLLLGRNRLKLALARAKEQRNHIIDQWCTAEGWKIAHEFIKHEDDQELDAILKGE